VAEIQQQIKQQHILVVEGTDERNFFEALLRHINIPKPAAKTIMAKLDGYAAQLRPILLADFRTLA
jgi:hypothetical protein